MNNNRRKPSLRFRGFTDDWEQRKLGDMGTTFTGLSGKTKDDFGHGDARFVTYMNVFTNPVSDPDRVEAVEIDKSQNAVQHGDVFFTTSSETPEEVGMSSVWLENTDNTYLNSFCFGYRPTERIDPHYMAYMLRSEAVREKIIYLAQGISRYNISKNGVMQIEVPVPNINEQRLVGEFFSNLDTLITLHQRKYDKLLNVKKAMLEKMFPKEGEKVPEIRFKSFTGEWKQCKIKEITDRIIVGLATSVTPYYRESGVPLLRNMNIKENYLDDSDLLYLDEKYAKANESKMIHANDVLTVHTGSNIGLTCITPEKYEGCLSFTTLITTPNKNTLDSLFLMQYMNSKLGKKKIEAIITAGGKPNLNSGDLEKLEVVYPRIEEQRKIGKYFQYIDNLITLQQSKIEKLKNIKNAMLEKMFV